MARDDNSRVIAYIMLRAGIERYCLRLPRVDVERIGEFDCFVAHNMLDPLGALYLGEQINSALKQGPNPKLDIEIPIFSAIPAVRNIEVANYGESDPKGLHVTKPEDISFAFNAEMRRSPRGFHGDGVEAPRRAGIAPWHVCFAAPADFFQPSSDNA